MQLSMTPHTSLMAYFPAVSSHVEVPSPVFFFGASFPAIARVCLRVWVHVCVWLGCLACVCVGFTHSSSEEWFCWRRFLCPPERSPQVVPCSARRLDCVMLWDDQMLLVAENSESEAPIPEVIPHFFHV